MENNQITEPQLNIDINNVTESAAPQGGIPIGTPINIQPVSQVQIESNNIPTAPTSPNIEQSKNIDVSNVMNGFEVQKEELNEQENLSPSFDIQPEGGPNTAPDVSINAVNELGLDIEESIEDDLAEFQKTDPNEIDPTQEGSENAKVISTMKSSDFGYFLQILEVLSSKLTSNDILSINKGHVLASLDGGTLHCDLSKYFEDHSMELKDPKGAIKLLKLIKGGIDVIILEDLRKYIIYNTNKGETLQYVSLNKSTDEQKAELKLTELGEEKLAIELDQSDISDLISAKSSIGSLYYNVIIDSNTFELVEININDKYKRSFLSRKGRDTQRYRVREIFPVQKAQSTVFKINKGGPLLPADKLFFSTINTNKAGTVIVYQTAASEFSESAEAEIDFI